MNEIGIDVNQFQQKLDFSVFNAKQTCDHSIKFSKKLQSQVDLAQNDHDQRFKFPCQRYTQTKQSVINVDESVNDNQDNSSTYTRQLSIADMSDHGRTRKLTRDSLSSVFDQGSVQDGRIRSVSELKKVRR